MSSNAQNENNAEHNIEIWKIKRLIKSLEAARGYVFFVCHLIAIMANSGSLDELHDRFQSSSVTMACWTLFCEFSWNTVLKLSIHIFQQRHIYDFIDYS
jgi:hypothetical protein